MSKTTTQITKIFTILICLTSSTACVNPTNIKAANDASNPQCAPMMLALPDKIAQLNKYETNSQATSVWGKPSTIILRCGVTPIQNPTTAPCTEVNGTDWIIKETEENYWQFVTYGRNPAVEITIDSENISGTSVLIDLNNAINKIPAQQHCTNPNTLEKIATN